MKLIIFGATGMIGKELVKQALFNQHQVVAFGRNVFTANFPETPDLTLFHGALFDSGEVGKAMQGCDAVLSALGGQIDGDDKTRSLGIKIILEQMKKKKLNRIVAVGGLGVLNTLEDKLILEQEDYPAEYEAVGREHLKALRYLEASELDWTMICPPQILPHEATGNFITEANYPPTPNNMHINAGDVALFMLKAIATNQYIQQKVGISNL